MFIIRSYSECGVGDTIEEAIDNFEEETRNVFDPSMHFIYEAKEIKVQRKFEVIKED